jgi:hypothetical protein
VSDLTTLQRFKDWLGVEDDTDDERMSLMLSAASAFVESYCQRTFGSATYTEYYDGSDCDMLTLRQWPIISLTGIYEGGSAVSLASGEDPYANPAPEIVIYKEEGRLVRPFSAFFGYRRYYKVVYVAGYATIPADLIDATLCVATVMLREKDRAGIASKTRGQETAQLMRSVPESAQRTLDRYRDMTIGRAA